MTGWGSLLCVHRVESPDDNDDAGPAPRATLRVRDDGAGFDGRAADEDHRGGLGLHVMRYRAHQLGGTLSIHPAPPRGTAVCCTFPVVAPAPSTASLPRV